GGKGSWFSKWFKSKPKTETSDQAIPAPTAPPPGSSPGPPPPPVGSYDWSRPPPSSASFAPGPPPSGDPFDLDH
ncbi:hypothetical protein CRUP_024284, partial [Coryphaenoides rupestris]